MSPGQMPTAENLPLESPARTRSTARRSRFRRNQSYQTSRRHFDLRDPPMKRNGSPSRNASGVSRFCMLSGASAKAVLPKGSASFEERDCRPLVLRLLELFALRIFGISDKDWHSADHFIVQRNRSTCMCSKGRYPQVRVRGQFLTI